VKRIPKVLVPCISERLMEDGELSILARYRYSGDEELVYLGALRACVGSQPQRGVGWLHRLPHHIHQVVA
jgi:hypothetical protein